MRTVDPKNGQRESAIEPVRVDVGDALGRKDVRSVDVALLIGRGADCGIRIPHALVGLDHRLVQNRVFL